MNRPYNPMPLDAWKAAARDGPPPADLMLLKSFVDPDVKMIAEERQVILTITTAGVDRDRDTIAVDGWDLTHYRNNPVVLWAHQYGELPLGTAELVVEPDRIRARDTFHERDLNPMADTVFRMMTLPVPSLRAASVGFRSLEFSLNEDRHGVDFKRQEMLEHSIVPIPSNPEALAAAKSLLGAEAMQPLITWCEATLDTWHDEAGMWMPKAFIERSWQQLTPPQWVTNPGGVTFTANGFTVTSNDTVGVGNAQLDLAPDDDDLTVEDFLASATAGYDHHDPPSDPLADLDTESLRALVLPALGALVADAMKSQITAITGRLVD